MTNEELLLEYEFTTALYIAAVENKNEEAVAKHEKYLCELMQIIQSKENRELL